MVWFHLWKLMFTFLFYYFRSDLVAAELDTIKEFNRILEHEGDCCPKTVFVLFNTQCPVLLNNSYLLGKPEEKCPDEEVAGESVDESDIINTLQRTSKTIRDIDALVTAAMQTALQSWLRCLELENVSQTFEHMYDVAQTSITHVCRSGSRHVVGLSPSVTCVFKTFYCYYFYYLKWID